MKAEMITLISDDSVFLPARAEFALSKTKLGMLTRIWAKEDVK